MLFRALRIGAVALGCCALLTAPSVATMHAARPSELQTLLDQRVAGLPGVGIIVGIIDRGKVTILKAGSSGTGRPLDEHTLFEVGSVTKTFTATILAGMVLDGKVGLDDPVAKYLPHDVKMPSKDGDQITLLNLATQHSGLPRLPDNLKPANAQDPYADYSVADLYAFLGSYRLTRNPGESYEYSNLGVGLLGDALANAAGETYAQLLNDQVLKPLDMSDTSLTTTPQLQPYLAQGHDADGDPTAPWTFLAIAPAGALRSSLDDMLKYLQCNLGGGPLASACLFAQQPRSTFPGNEIGLIWWTDDGTHIINHGGDTGGYHAWIAMSGDRTKGVVVLTNGGTPVQDVAMHIIDPSVPLDNPPAVVQLAPTTLDQYVGTYVDENSDIRFTIARSGDELRAQVTGQPFFRIYPSAKDQFFYRVVDAQLDFTRDPSGTVNAVILHQNGNTVVAVKPGMAQPPVPQPSFPPMVKLDAQTLAGYEGTYLAGQGLQFIVTLQGTQLSVQVTGQPSIPVFPSAKDRFYYKVVNAQIDFERDASGDVVDLILHQNGQDIKALKAQVSS